MADIQSAVAEIRRGKKEEEEERTNHSMKILHRATIKRFCWRVNYYTCHTHRIWHWIKLSN